MNPDFYDPSIATANKVVPAKRPNSLAGKVIGLYDNTKEQADIVLDALGEQLVKQHDVKELLTRRGTHYSKPAPPEVIEEMVRKCDVVICALGG